MQKELIYYLLLVGFFYLSFYLLIPKLYVRGRYLWLAITVTAVFCITSYLPSLIITKKPDEKSGPPSFKGRHDRQPPGRGPEDGPPAGRHPENHRPTRT